MSPYVNSRTHNFLSKLFNAHSPHDPKGFKFHPYCDPTVFCTAICTPPARLSHI